MKHELIDNEFQLPHHTPHGVASLNRVRLDHTMNLDQSSISNNGLLQNTNALNASLDTSNGPQLMDYSKKTSMKPGIHGEEAWAFSRT